MLSEAGQGCHSRYLGEDELNASVSRDCPSLGRSRLTLSLILYLDDRVKNVHHPVSTCINHTTPDLELKLSRRPSKLRPSPVRPRPKFSIFCFPTPLSPVVVAQFPTAPRTKPSHSSPPDTAPRPDLTSCLSCPGLQHRARTRGLFYGDVHPGDSLLITNTKTAQSRFLG